MTAQNQYQINDTIDKLLKQASETGSVMLVVFQENNPQNGRHFSAYGSGVDLKNLLIDCAKHNDGLKKVLKAAITEL